MKVKLELVFNEDGRIFLNYWENVRGKDVCCVFRNHDLYLMGETESPVPISIGAFIDKVRNNIPRPTEGE